VDHGPLSALSLGRTHIDMPSETREVAPGPSPRQVRTATGALLDVPEQWALLAPGDAALTRRVKRDGPSWTIREKRGRRVFSQGVWAPAHRIEFLHTELQRERSSPTHQHRLDASRRRRALEQEKYVLEFQAEIFRFLDFDRRHQDLAVTIARAICGHSVPVGSGTVARTRRIPIDRRAEAATIAWLRHHTTEYDDMTIPKVKGMRRELRRMLADRSRELLRHYRRGQEFPMDRCPLRAGLARAHAMMSDPEMDLDIPDIDIDIEI